MRRFLRGSAISSRTVITPGVFASRASLAIICGFVLRFFARPAALAPSDCASNTSEQRAKKSISRRGGAGCHGSSGQTKSSTTKLAAPRQFQPAPSGHNAWKVQWQRIVGARQPQRPGPAQQQSQIPRPACRSLLPIRRATTDRAPPASRCRRRNANRRRA
jgi:hypothetical protein